MVMVATARQARELADLRNASASARLIASAARDAGNPTALPILLDEIAELALLVTSDANGVAKRLSAALTQYAAEVGLLERAVSLALAQAGGVPEASA